jgi:hypothetical protein
MLLYTAPSVANVAGSVYLSQWQPVLPMYYVSSVSLSFPSAFPSFSAPLSVG